MRVLEPIGGSGTTFEEALDASLPAGDDKVPMNQRHGETCLTEFDGHAVSGNERLGVPGTVGNSGVVERQCWPAAGGAGLAEDRFRRIHDPIMVGGRPLSEAQTGRLSRD